MKALKKLANRISSILRHAEDIVCNPVLANYTPAGPGSLATGQSAAAGRGGPYIRPDACGPDEHGGRTQPTYAEYSMPLRQVFWI